MSYVTTRGRFIPILNNPDLKKAPHLEIIWGMGIMHKYMRLRPGLFIVAAFSLFLFPSLLLASREEAMNDTLGELESGLSVCEAAKTTVSPDKIKQMDASLKQEQAAYEIKRRYRGAEDKPKEGESLFKEKALMASLSQPIASRSEQPVAKKQQSFYQRILQVFRPKAKPVESKKSLSRNTQDQYAHALDKYDNAKDRERREQKQKSPSKIRESSGQGRVEAKTGRKSIPQRILQFFSPKPKSTELDGPASCALQDHYVYALEKYENAGEKEKKESDRENLFKPKEGSRETVEEAKRVFYISGGYNANHMHYKETRGGDTLDEDYGKLKGFYLEAGYKGAYYIPWIMGRPFVEGYYRRYDDLITYDGAWQNSLGESGPLSFEEKAEVHRFGIKVGAYRDFLKKGELFGYFDIGKRIWYRGENGVIERVLTYAEKYWWIYYGLGIGINYRILPHLSCGVDLEGMTTHKSQRKMRADLYEGATFHLGSVYGTEIKLPIKYRFWQNVSFDFTPYFTYWKIHESDTRMISGSPYVEPDSKTHIEGLLAGFSYLF